MKNMNKITLASSCILALAAFSGSALAGVEKRVVVSHYTSAGEVSAQASQCFPLSNGSTWCVSAPAGYANKVSAQSVMRDSAKLTSQALRVPESLSVSEAIALLKSTGWYRSVEADVAISTQTWNTVVSPDDQYYSEQYYFNQNSEIDPTSSSVMAQWAKIKNPEKNVNVYVLDTGFRLNDDIVFADGFNFDTSQDTSSPGPGFLEDDYTAEGQTCTNNHGIGVSSVIGAQINNGQSITGTSGNVTIHPLRVMHCGSGFMSDVATALNWLSGQSVSGFPDFTGQPGVVNLSLGGRVGASACPSYLQDAINNAVTQGFTVVSAAGNQAEDASNFIPGKCDNVITVGAASTGRSNNPADLASFSNYGEHLDVMVAGEDIAGLMSDNRVGFWAGTSFASPLVAGIIANAQKDYAFTPTQWSTLMSASSISRWAEGARCETLGCANGILDAAVLHDNAQKMLDGTLDTVTLSLNAVSACRQQWMLDNLSKGQSLCDQAIVEMGSMADLKAGDVVEIHALASGQTVQDRTGLVGQYTTNKIIVDKSVFDGRAAFVVKCNSEGACSDPIQLSTASLTDTPEACR